MRNLLALVGLLLVMGVKAAEIVPRAVTNVVVTGGSDPTKLPLAGGAMSGNILMSAATQVQFSTATGTGAYLKGTNNGIGASADVVFETNKGVVFSTTTQHEIRGTTAGANVQGELSFSTGTALGAIKASTDTQGGLDISASAGGFTASVFNFRANDSDSVAIFLSTTTGPLNSESVGMNFQPTATGGDGLNVGGGAGFGRLRLQEGEGRLSLSSGSGNFKVFQSSVSSNADTFTMNGTTLDASPLTTVKVPGINFVTGVTAAKALCINASGNLSACTTVVGATGGCTCP